MTKHQLAQANLATLLNHPYFGRLVMAGISPNGMDALVLTAISGRSEGSRNRNYKLGYGGRIYTTVADRRKQVGDPRLTLYDTQRENRGLGLFAASNGRQTGNCVASQYLYLSELLSGWGFEPDEPNFTPRISCRFNINGINGPISEFAIHRRDATGICAFDTWIYIPEMYGPGFGYYLCTYEERGNPLPSFVGEPRIVPIGKHPLLELVQGLASWDYLAAVSLKRIPLNGSAPTVEIWNKR